MKDMVQFESTRFGPLRGEDAELINPGRYGKALVQFLAEKLTAQGFAIERSFSEDWGWCARVRNPAFALHLGCGVADEADGRVFRIFAFPVRENLWHRMRAVKVPPTTRRLLDAVDAILRAEPSVSKIEWSGSSA